MRIFSDPHLGLERKAHTTKESRKRLKGRLSEKALSIISPAGSGAVVCAGDLFDTFSNSELDIVSAAGVAQFCDVILAGNHDSLNQADAVGSLDVVGELCEDTTIVKALEFDKPCYEQGELEGMSLAFIPHHPSQELFDTALLHFTEAANAADTCGEKLRAVFLHCNYENSMTDGHDTSLNLTKAQAEALLEISDYIFIGHEHQPRELLDGRLIICGNIHPTSFSDISDKYYYDLTADSLEKTLCWSQADNSAKIEYTGDIFPTIPEGVDFIDITGQITSEKGADLAEYVRECWEVANPLMVRNNVAIVPDDNVVIEAVDFHTLPDQIADQLKGGELEDTYTHYRGKAGC